jgi:hypothetical protein
MWFLYSFNLCYSLYGFKTQRFLYNDSSSCAYCDTHRYFVWYTVNQSEKSDSNNNFWFCSLYSFHKIGLLVLFLHDIADIWLEMTKMMRCLSAQEGNPQCSRWRQGSYVSFSIFTLSW